ncbi:MAG: alpha/beta hydrolase [Formosimonas sp.]
MNQHFTTTHTLTAKDAATVAALHAQVSEFKGGMLSVEGREAYDTMIADMAAAEHVAYEAGSVANISGTWCKVAHAPSDAVILYIHGGGYMLGNAHAYRHVVGQFAVRTTLNAFVVEYGLAPEQPFPAGLEDVKAAYLGLLAQGYQKIIIVGDSAGGGLSLALLQEHARNNTPPATACVVISPWTDLALTGASQQSRAEEEPFLTTQALQTCANLYAGAHDVTDPRISPLYGNHSQLPSTQIHVGTREILLDDSIMYAERVHAAGSAISLHVWDGMIHVFSSQIGVLEAAESSMNIMSEFILNQLNPA